MGKIKDFIIVSLVMLMYWIVDFLEPEDFADYE